MDAGRGARLPRAHVRLPRRGARPASQRRTDRGVPRPRDRTAAGRAGELRAARAGAVRGGPTSCSTRTSPEAGREHSGEQAAGESLRARAYLNPPGAMGVGTVNTPAWQEAEIPSANLHADARGVAGVYAALAREDPVLLAPEVLAEATTEHSAGTDLVLERPSRFGLGFQLTQPERPLGPHASGFGHFGAGGSLGFADPTRGSGLRLPDEPRRPPVAGPAQPCPDRGHVRVVCERAGSDRTAGT